MSLINSIEMYKSDRSNGVNCGNKISVLETFLDDELKEGFSFWNRSRGINNNLRNY